LEVSTALTFFLGGQIVKLKFLYPFPSLLFVAWELLHAKIPGLTVFLPLQWSLQRPLNSTDLGAQDTVAALQELSDFGSFVSFVQLLLAGKAALNTVLEALAWGWLGLNMVELFMRVTMASEGFWKGNSEIPSGNLT